MKIIKQPGEYSYVYSKYLEPIAKVMPGEVFAVQTKDAFENRITDESDLPAEVLGDYVNPQTGPIFVEGAEPGDTLIVDIIDIQPTRDYAISAIIKDFGGLTRTETTRMLNKPLPERIWKYNIKDGFVTHNENLSFPWRPFLGTIGTSPDLEAVSALVPSKHGGNMDVPDVKPGNSIHLPVKVEGGYFYIGDCHAGQGDGELCGGALEIPAETKLKFTLKKNESMGLPSIESRTGLMVVCSAKPMEDAARIAYAELVKWIIELGWDEMEAYQALTQIGQLYVRNIVNPSYSLVAKIDKKYALTK